MEDSVNCWVKTLHEFLLFISVSIWVIFEVFIIKHGAIADKFCIEHSVARGP